MSVNSFARINCRFPKSTKVNHNNHMKTDDLGDTLLISCDVDGEYEGAVLDELVDFFDRPLDEVRGLVLHVTYESWDGDGYYRSAFDIANGKKTYKESTIQMVERPMSTCPFGYGQSIKIERAKQAWHELDDVCIDDDECIDEDFHSNVLNYTYEKGTSRYDIWHDIEDNLGVSVAYLMGESKKPFFAE